MFRRCVIFFFFWLIAISKTSYAQNEYFGALNYQNLTFNRIAGIPSVTWLISDNSAYDQQNHRYFFLGSAAITGPWYLYTVDATTGVVLNRVLCPGNYNSSDYILGLHFDNESGILYALHNVRSTGGYYFSTVDPSTGNVTTVAFMPQIQGYGLTQNSYSSKDHIYFFYGVGASGVPGIFAFNAINGAMLWESSSANISDIAFDNTNGKLYGLEIIGYGRVQLDSLEVATGIPHKISSPFGAGLAQLSTTAIDETNGRYIFLTVDTTQCATRRLYVLDINNGQIVSNQPYPYAEATGDPDAENVLSFNFDNTNGKLYALNWHVNDSIRSDILHITASVNPVCKSDPITFTARTPRLFQGPSYHWLVNSFAAGTNAPNFTSSQLSDGDIVYCIITDTLPCDVGKTDTSNRIVVHINNDSINIGARTNTICQGDTDIFIANTNTSLSTLTWKINGIDAGHNDSLITSSLMNGDKVSCVAANGNGCTLTANTITMTVLPKPSISFSPDTILLLNGNSVQLMPHITGPAPQYFWSPSYGLSDTTIAGPIASPTHDTKYYLTAGLPEGCFSIASIYVKIIHQDTVTCLNFKMVKGYPNPSSDKIQIAFGGVWKSGEIIVFNSIGQRVNAIKIENQDHVYLYKKFLASGVYTLKFICPQGVLGILPVAFLN
jgi:hypothetical protein